MPQISLKTWLNQRLRLWLLILFVVTTVITVLVMDFMFRQFETHRTRNDLRRVVALLERDGQTFAASAADYGFWEETFEFVNLRNDSYWKHFSPNLMQNNQMDWVLIVRNNQVFAAKQLREHRVEDVPAAQQMTWLQMYQSVVHQPDCTKGTAIGWQGAQPWMLAYAPIVDSNYQNPVQGCVVFGRQISGAYHFQLAKLSGGEFHLHAQKREPSASAQDVVLYDETLKVLVLRKLEYHLTHHKWFAIFGFLVCEMALIGAFLLILGSLIQRKITQRIVAFSTLADQYKSTHASSIRWPKSDEGMQDEIDNLGGALNELVQKVESQLQSIRHDADQDALTNIGNRRYLLRRMDEFLSQRLEHVMGATGALILIDLDGFKFINDHLGHDAGDETLRIVAKRLLASTRSEDVVVRLGGDEFAIFIPSLTATAALQLADRLCEEIAEPIHLQMQLNSVTSSIGVVCADASLSSIELLRHADIAMYEAKRSGKNQARLYDYSLDQLFSRKVEMQQALRQALKAEGSGLAVWFQPIVDHQQNVVSLEALVRWRWNDIFVSPVEFIPLAEESDLIVLLGLWVCDQVCQTLVRLRAQGWVGSCSVNVSIRQFVSQQLCGQIEHLLNKYQLPAKTLAVELTESLLAKQESDVVTQLSQLSRMGLDVYLDDFGTGYSSLSRLQQLPLDILKIDRAFVSPLPMEDRGLVQAIVDMAHHLGLIVVAEGVETIEQYQLLCALKVDRMQGYYFAKPMPEEQLVTWLFQQTRSA